MRDRLVEDRQPVAGASLGGAGDCLQSLVLGLHPLSFRDTSEVGGEPARRDSAQVEPLAA